MSASETPLKALLRRLGWTQKQLADATGILRTDINAIVNGRAALGSERRAKIAEALGVSVLEVGAPEAEADVPGLSLLARLAQLEDDLAGSVLGQAKLTRQVAALQARVRRLEAQGEQGRGAAGSQA